ncbi:molybdopterin-containing oxidoreductase family protein [Lacrimispora sp. 210928-DFI.3.58]|uniref:molybdopterin-containing oxidoreductase family protein n=1 Tax=Lacrimispora sp. 210928-DFI.3.58 TaxID=2883214 RepID=UPI001D06FC6A|nr:molybdopterin-dependent oxidoreductase [Lacrimispora sp. 210928-DFI.3.58]MCB7320837.1 molybdopterin-dependent oxidoreductase [Lacrimispora sp. 210928-DFI.3.58]
MSYTQKTICPYDCPAACGIVAETDGKRILGVKGDAGHPVTKGLLCRKMQEYERSVHSPDRILTPMKRQGQKGEGRFVPITWEEAIEEITGRWKEILQNEGGRAILPFYYSGVMSVIQRKCGNAFFNRMGACTLIQTLCSSAKGAGYEAVLGKTGCLDPRELPDSDFYIIWGSNVKATRIHTMPVLAAARKMGKRVVLIEACASDMSAYCDETLLIRPGTDGALALAMMHVLEEKGLTDKDFLEEYGEGYGEFQAVLTGCTPEWAQEITGIPAAAITALAEEYGRAKAPSILLGSGPSRYGNGGMTVRLITILSTLTGAWGKPGGGLCGCNPGAGNFVETERVTRLDFRRGEERKVNINQLASALTGANGETPVKSLYVYGSNPVGSVCSQKGIIEGLKREDLFTVVHERFMTDTARYADILLPATFSVEQTDCYTAYGYCTFGTAKKIIEPAGQCKSNWDTFCLLAKAMGYEEDYFKHTEEEMLEELLDHPGTGLDGAGEEGMRVLREGGVISTPFADHRRFLTDTGRVKITNHSLPEPVPHYTDCHGGEYPLKLIAVPSCYTLNSIFLERESLVEQKGEAELLLHPADAKARGIEDGDPIKAFNDLAEVNFKARVTGLVAEGAAAAPGIFCSDTTGTELLVNALHHERLSDIGEATTLNDNTIDVRKIG